MMNFNIATLGNANFNVLQGLTAINASMSDSNNSGVSNPTSIYVQLPHEVANTTNGLSHTSAPQNFSPQMQTMYSLVNTNNVPGPAQVNPSPSAVTSESTQSQDHAATMIKYRQYYTDVLKYFKGLLDSVESQNTSSTSRLQARSGVEGLTSDPWANSRTVMQGYFRQSGSRDFQWVSWHNYLSWISRTHPEWFEIFRECSKQTGIDWEGMHQKWLISQNKASGSNSVFDLSRPPPVPKSDPQQVPPPPIADPFSLTSIPPPKDPRVWCEDCDLYFPNERSFAIHLRGVVHIQHALTKTVIRNSNSILDIPNPKWPPNVDELPLSLGSVMPPNKPVVDTHCAPKLQLRLQHLLDICIQPLVGLNYVTEFQRNDPLECVYICDLCNKEALVSSAVIRHVCGIRHRMAYLKLHYPPLYELLKLDRNPRNIKKRRLAFYAQQIESNEGRKRLSIMIEKEDSTLKTRIVSGVARQKVKSNADLKHTQASPGKQSPPTSGAGSTANNHDEGELEEGEMLDFSCSSSDEVEQTASTVDGIVATSNRPSIPKPSIAFSPASSHFSSDEEDEEGSCSHDLPTFFTSGVEMESVSAIASVAIHLPDFEVAFVSERPLLPASSAAQGTKVFDEFIDQLSELGLLGARRLPCSLEKSTDEDSAVPNVSGELERPTDMELTQSFKKEVNWALEQLKTSEQKANPLTFSYGPRPKRKAPSEPLLPCPPAASDTAESLKNGCTEGSGACATDTSESESHGAPTEAVRKAVRTLLEDQESISSLLSSLKHLDKKASPLLSQPSTSTICTKEAGSSDIGATTTLSKSQATTTVKKAKVDNLDGVKRLLSSPIEALNALLQRPAASTNEQPTINVAPNIAITHSAAPSDIFDGYSYYNRQEAEKAKATKEKQQRNSAPPVSKPPLLRCTTTASKSAVAKQTPTTSRLAAFADMLGVNEPPPPPQPSCSLPLVNQNSPVLPPQGTQPTPAAPAAAAATTTAAAAAPLSVNAAAAAWLAQQSSLWQSQVAAMMTAGQHQPANSAATAAYMFNPGGALFGAAAAAAAAASNPLLRPPFWRP